MRAPDKSKKKKKEKKKDKSKEVGLRGALNCQGKANLLVLLAEKDKKKKSEKDKQKKAQKKRLKEAAKMVASKNHPRYPSPDASY